ncbi:hypothetical protein B7494_g2994 [Chlorociboria aeruginascens]|nr:hypothetical protein B7494_g2994 [Chlorociboria aeruginascens]
MRGIQYDSLAWARSEAEYAAWCKKLLLKETVHTVGSFMAKQNIGGLPTELKIPQAGGFNACLQLNFENSGSLLIRFPQPGVRLAEEKIHREVDVMRYVTDVTAVTVPLVLCYGMSDEGPAAMGPFILMEYIRHARSMNDVLNTPGLRKEDQPILNPDIPETTLKFAYGEMANVLLQVSRPSFSRIGSIAQLEDGSWSVVHRPLTMNMSQLVSNGNLPPSMLPSTTFESASSYFHDLAGQHLDHLSAQRNDAIESAEDCRYKYVARHLFRKIISEHRFPVTELEPFKLFCDDFRPSNVLVDDNDKIVGVIDWEFTYAAPAEFAYSPPWWLLLEPPEEWPHGILDWSREYEPRLRTFLEALREQEDSMISDGQLTEAQRLSARMKESWETGDFWMAYAARKSWALDVVFWRMINPNPRFFNKPGYDEGLKLLSQEERDGMEGFVQRKLKEMEEHTLVDWEEQRRAH